MTNRPILISALMLGLGALAGAQQSGTISGKVLDEKGRPVSGATVTATQTDNNDGIEKSVQSDSSGNFAIGDLRWGKYAVIAEKPESGYPRTPAAFYGSGTQPVLEISAGNASASTKIVFRRKEPAIVGTVIDDEASVPVAATFLLRHAREPANALSLEQGSNYRILVPAGVRLTMEVSAQGYKTWYYPGTNDYKKKTTFVVNSRQSLKINIRLDGESADSACLDRPQRWALALDSPDFLWHDSQDDSRQRSCNQHPGSNMTAVLTLSAH